MPYSLVQNARSEGSSVTNVTVTPTSTLTAGNCLVVVVWEFSATFHTISNVQDQSNNAISFSVVGAGTSSGSHRLLFAVCENLPSGVTAVKVTIAGTASTLAAQIVEVSGLKTSGAVDVSSYQTQTSVATTTDAISSGSVVPTSQPALVFAATRNASGGGAASVGTGFTSVGQGVNSLGASEHQRITSTSSIAGTFTAAASGNNHVTGVVVLLEATASGLSITSVTPSSFDDGRTGIVIAGSGFGASQGSSTLTIGGQAQTVTAWSDTSITFTSVRGSNSMGTRSLTITKG